MDNAPMTAMPRQCGLFTDEDLNTLLSICTILEKTQPEPGSGMAQQIATTRNVVDRIRTQNHLPQGAMIENVEIVKVEAVARAGYSLTTRDTSHRFLPLMAEDGLRPDNAKRLMTNMNGVMHLFKLYGPEGEIATLPN